MSYYKKPSSPKKKDSVRKNKSGLLHWLCIKIRTGNWNKPILLTRFFLMESRVCVNESQLSDLCREVPHSIPYRVALFSPADLATCCSRGPLKS